VAGTGTGGHSGDGGSATSAKLSAPMAVAVDAPGNLYIADTDNSRIRMVTHSTGYISTIAGDGVAGDQGDGGLAVNSMLNLPWRVAVNPNTGYVYISDYENNYVRIVKNSNKFIYAYAGQAVSPGLSGNNVAATSALLSAPMGLAVDASGNLFIADSANQRIREVVYATLFIVTVAGDGTASFGGDGGMATSAALNWPSGVAVDPAGNLYIADTNNQRIRLVVESTGYISTVAGNGTSGFSGDGGPATSAKTGQPGYNGVPAVAVDASYNFYIADETNNRIRAVGAVQ